MDRYYILDGHTPKAVDLMTWAKWFESALSQRIVCQEHVGNYWVSTVFLGINHQFHNGPPLLFETCAFERAGNGHGENGAAEIMDRCSTWHEAEVMHRRCCMRLRKVS